MSLACALKSKNLKFPSFPTRFNRILSKPCYRTKYEVLERPKWLLRAFLNGHICCCNLLGGCKDSYDCDALKTVWEEPPGTASRQLSACFQKICRWCRWVPEPAFSEMMQLCWEFLYIILKQNISQILSAQMRIWHLLYPCRLSERGATAIIRPSNRSAEAWDLHPWHPGHPFVLHFRIQVSVYGRHLWQDSCFLQS